jgi:predicted esterase
LPKATIDWSSLTVSGFSSGAFMATQFHFAYSSEVKGAGILAGGKYIFEYIYCISTHSKEHSTTITATCQVLLLLDLADGTALCR